MKRVFDVSDPISGLHRTLRLSTVPPGPGSSESPARRVSSSACAQVLRFVDELEPEATGALVFGDVDSPSGALLLEKGSICWGMAQGLSRRLTDLLRHQSVPPLSQEKVESVVQLCKRSGSPLGEALVAAGLVTSEGLRSGLKQHSAEAVATLARLKHTPRFLPHRRQTYDPKYSFSTVELLAAIGVLQVGPESVRARRALRAVVNKVASGVVFSRVSSSTTLLGVEERERFTVSQVGEMAAWAQGQLDVAEAVAPGLKLVSSAGAGGHSIVAWQDEELMFVAICRDQTSLARVLMAASRR